MKPIWLAIVVMLGGLALGAKIPVAQGQQQGGQLQLKQMKLTEKQVQNYISAQKKLVPLASKFEGTGDKPDPAIEKQVEQIARSSGFSSLQEFDDVGANISLVLGGLDPDSGQFTEPPEQIKKDMDEVKQDTQMSQQEKEQVLAEMQEALKAAAPLRFKENIVLVKKYQKELEPALPQEPTKK